MGAADRWAQPRGEPPGDETGIRLSPVSYIVLGLLAFAGPATPYDLKRLTNDTVSNLWSVNHSQLYKEPERLAGAGYLEESREPLGRRRKHYILTERGRSALKAWLGVPSAEFTELRDPGLLQLFFGGEPESLAKARLAVHEAKLEQYEQMYAEDPEAPPGWHLVLEAGIGHEREWIRFWSRIGGNG